jgi:hypothetical protein
MRGENFLAHLDGLGGTPVCRVTPVAHDYLCEKVIFQQDKSHSGNWCLPFQLLVIPNSVSLRKFVSTSDNTLWICPDAVSVPTIKHGKHHVFRHFPVVGEPKTFVSSFVF